jgi:hypothetical protein
LLGRPCPYPYRGQSIVWESISRWDPQRWGRAESLVPWRAGPNTRKTSLAFAWSWLLLESGPSSFTGRTGPSQTNAALVQHWKTPQPNSSLHK